MSQKKALKELEEAAAYLRKRYKHKPVVGIVLGTGLNSFVDEIEIEKEISYRDIPHFPVSTVKGHSGKLIFGKLSGKRVVAMAGRFHVYEGYDARDIVFPIRVMKLLGIGTLLLSNAAGSVNPAYQVGDLMIVKDHISMFMPNPLIGKNIDELGPRFPDMSEPYSSELIQKARTIAASQKCTVREGVYVAVTGPTYETIAEYKMLLAMGADVVGMSTVQEAIVAGHMGVRVFAMSVVTDIGIREDHHTTVSHDEVLAIARSVEPKLAAIFRDLVATI